MQRRYNAVADACVVLRSFRMLSSAPPSSPSQCLLACSVVRVFCCLLHRRREGEGMVSTKELGGNTKTIAALSAVHSPPDTFRTSNLLLACRPRPTNDGRASSGNSVPHPHRDESSTRQPLYRAQEIIYQQTPHPFPPMLFHVIRRNSHRREPLTTCNGQVQRRTSFSHSR